MYTFKKAGFFLICIFSLSFISAHIFIIPVLLIMLGLVYVWVLEFYLHPIEYLLI